MFSRQTFGGKGADGDAFVTGSPGQKGDVGYVSPPTKAALVDPDRQRAAAGWESQSETTTQLDLKPKK